MDQRNPKTVIFPYALFLHFPWDLSTCSAQGPIPNAPKCLFGPEVLIQKVLIMLWKGSRITRLVCKRETVGKIGEVDEMGDRELVLVVSVRCGEE